jgi:DNA-damage-inducible protein D
MNDLEKTHHQTFKKIKKINEQNQEFWYARDLQNVLAYSSWERFKSVIQKAVVACNNSKQPAQNHFHHVVKMVKIGSDARRKVEDFELSRYACYLIVQNGDSSKPVIANGQTYFAIQTRRQELADNEEFKNLQEDEKRLFLRNEIREHNKQLVDTANKAGVATNLDFAIFQNHGYMGLYGGLDAKAIHKRKELKKSQKILDHMESTELAANLFRATQTEEKLQRDNIKGKSNANQTHYEVGAKVRDTIEELGGAMPEDLPTPPASIKKLENEQKKKLIDGEIDNME